MPIIAESPPMIFGGGESPQPTPWPTNTPSPFNPTPFNPTPFPTQRPGSTPNTIPSEFVDIHQKFVEVISNKGCFKRDELREFTEQQITDHLSLSVQDKYLTKTNDMYCSMKGVHDLTESLKRVSSEKELIG